MLWVKGSGGDLRTSNVGNFASLYQDKLLSLQPIYAAAEAARPEDAKPKTAWWAAIRTARSI